MEISLKWTPSAGPKGDKARESYQWQIQGESLGGLDAPPPSPPIRPDACLKLKFLHRQDHMSLFHWPMFFKIKRGLHFATKLNSRDIRKCNYFWVSSYDLLPLLAKQYFLCQRWLAFTDWETRGHLCEKQLLQNSSTVLSEPKFGPPDEKFLDSPLEKWQGVKPFYSNQASPHQSDHKCKEPSVNEEILASPLNDVQ